MIASKAAEFVAVLAMIHATLFYIVYNLVYVFKFLNLKIKILMLNSKFFSLFVYAFTLQM